MRIVTLVALLAALGARPAGADVPASLLSFADAHPLTVLHLLAEALVPAGLELKAVDHREFPSVAWRWNPVDSPVGRERFSLDTRSSTDEFIAAFNRSQVRYRAESRHGVLVIRPVAGGAGYLESRPLSGRLAATGLLRFAEKVFKPLDDRLDGPGGRAGSLLGRPGEELRRDDVEIVVEASGLSVIDVLNDAARLAPGYPWLVVSSDDDEPRIERVGFGFGGGTTREIVLGPR
jgi:hypothetical protein